MKIAPVPSGAIFPKKNGYQKQIIEGPEPRGTEKQGRL
jgi:hypothetical protein